MLRKDTPGDMVSSGEYRLTVPVPPSKNHRLGYGRGKLYRSREAREYQAEVRLICVQHRLKPLKGPIRVFLVWYRRRRWGDLPERFIDLFDALEGLAYDNDSQIAQLYMERRDDDPKRPRVELVLCPM